MVFMVEQADLEVVDQWEHVVFPVSEAVVAGEIKNLGLPRSSRQACVKSLKIAGGKRTERDIIRGP